MGHKRVQMELIKKEKSRMITFGKRKTNLLKKASEFSILCGVDACVVIFGPKQKSQPVRAETWPSNSNEVRSIINRYKSSDQPRRCYNVSDYFAQKKKKIDGELTKLHKQIYKAKYPTWDDRLNNILLDQLRVLLGRLEAKIEIADKKLDMLRENQHMMDQAASSWMQANSQFSQNVSFDKEKYMKRSNNNQYSNNFLQLVSNPKPLDLQLPISFQLDQQSSYMERNNSQGYSKPLQLFSDVKPLNVQRLIHFQPMQNTYRTPLKIDLMEDAITKMFKDPHNSNQFVGRPNDNIQYMPYNGLPQVQQYPTSWKWDNMMFNNADDPLVSYIVPTMQPMLPPHMQFPMSSFPHQMRSCQLNEFNGNIDYERKDQN